MIDTSAVLRLVPQRHKTDCSVATLATLCGVSYEEALLAIGSRQIIKKGLPYTRQLKAAAKKLGKALVWQRTAGADEDAGIATIKSHRWDFDHLVLLRQGDIFDLQDMTVWSLQDYLAHYQATLSSLLTPAPSASS